MRLHLAYSNPDDQPTSPATSKSVVDWLDNREQLLDSLLSHLDGMAYCCLPDEHWTMLYVSKGCHKLTGYMPEELLNNEHISYEELTLEEDRERVRETIKMGILHGQRFEIEYRIKTAAGEIKWVSERGIGFVNQSGKVEAIEGFIQDITARKSSDQSLQEAEQRYRSIFENTVEGIFQTTPQGQYISANPALAKIYGFESPQELITNLNNIGQQLYVELNKRQEFSELIELRGRVTNFESQVYRHDGSIIWITENARAVKNDSGNLIYYEGTVEDITELKNRNQLIEYQATHDILTGLPNRALLKDRLQQSISNADRTRNQLAVVFVDLDRFKDVNDTMGHQAGDQLLIAMSKRLQGCVRDSDTISRPGGDEFVLILSNLQSPEALNQTLERILTATAQPYTINQRELTVTSSLGISIYPDDGRDSETLLRHADNAMYKAKAAGKNNFQFFTKDFNAMLIERLNLGYHMRNAVMEDEFVLHYQPKYSAATAEIIGMEALVRWESIHFGLVSPSKFIPIAEEIGLINKIGSWVINTACRQCLAIYACTGRMLPVAVNVSPKQFYGGQLVRLIESALSETGLDPSYLEVEITEGLFIHEPANFIEVLKDLKAIGVKLAIDDFGTGYSSMSYLKHFPIDTLKIDQSFVFGLEQDPANQAILKAIVSLGHNLGLKVIAEGVETDMEREFLVSIGCDELQGFLFSKPMAVPDLEAYIHSHA